LSKEVTPVMSSRGFAHMAAIEGNYPEPWSVRVYESSAAMEPFIWLAMSEGNHAHLDLEKATQLRDQLTWLIENHYQVKDR